MPLDRAHTNLRVSSSTSTCALPVLQQITVRDLAAGEGYITDNVARDRNRALYYSFFLLGWTHQNPPNRCVPGPQKQETKWNSMDANPRRGQKQAIWYVMQPAVAWIMPLKTKTEKNERAKPTPVVPCRRVCYCITVNLLMGRVLQYSEVQYCTVHDCALCNYSPGNWAVPSSPAGRCALQPRSNTPASFVSPSKDLERPTCPPSSCFSSWLRYFIFGFGALCRSYIFFHFRRLAIASFVARTARQRATLAPVTEHTVQQAHAPGGCPTAVARHPATRHGSPRCLAPLNLPLCWS